LIPSKEPMSGAMKTYRATTICATAVLTLGLATLCHEAAHVVIGEMVGGRPTLMTATETRGDFDSLSPAGFALFGAAGSLVNLLFCGLGLWLLSRRPVSAEQRLFAWFFFAVNGTLVTTKMLGEPIAGFGDWMTILSPFPGTAALRAVVATLGAGGLIFVVRRSGIELAGLLPPGDTSRRMAEARRIVALGALAATVLVLGGAVLNPVGLTRGALLALGAGPGQFVPIAFGLRRVPGIAARSADPRQGATWPWLLSAGALLILTWFVAGPGIALSHPPP
jgi:hypothetical protein